MNAGKTKATPRAKATAAVIERLTDAGYRFVGRNPKTAAVKVCTYTRKSLLGQGVCYKQKFYGINSHRCLQCTPNAFCCTHQCVFCWRDTDVTVPTAGEEKIEIPALVDEMIAAQKKLLIGFKGNDKVDAKMLDEALNPNQAAISLAGEPTLFPQLGGLVKEFRKRGFTTFVVTNGTNPDALRKLKPLPTQLYVTLAAPNEEVYLATCKPASPKLWNKFLESLDVVRKLKCRKVARLTLVKGLNMTDPEGYAGLIKRMMPDYVEPKAYMHVGYSTNRLGMNNMPSFVEINDFSEQLAKLTGYKIRDESPQSRVTLLCRDDEAFEKRMLRSS